jgi:hypothetical protein
VEQGHHTDFISYLLRHIAQTREHCEPAVATIPTRLYIQFNAVLGDVWIQETEEPPGTTTDVHQGTALRDVQKSIYSPLIIGESSRT